MSPAEGVQKAPVRTSAQHAGKVAQIAAQRRARDVLPTQAEPDDGAVRAVLGDLVHNLTVCAGGCGLRLLRFTEWEKLDKQKRGRLRELGINRVSSYGRCWKCTETGAPKSGKARKYFGQKISAELKAQIPQIWAEIQADGGATPELGKRLGVTRERARQLVHELGLPHTDARNARTQAFLEELEFLAGFHLGVYELAERFGLTPDEFVSKVEGYRVRGLTERCYLDYFRNSRNAA